MIKRIVVAIVFAAFLYFTSAALIGGITGAIAGAIAGSLNLANAPTVGSQAGTAAVSSSQYLLVFFSVLLSVFIVWADYLPDRHRLPNRERHPSQDKNV